MHLAAGVAYWRRADLSIYSLSPPLLRDWAAVPAVLDGAKAPDPAASHDYEVGMRHMAYVDDFLDANWNTFEHLLFVSRMGMIPISCLTALLIFTWARDLFGALSGLAAWRDVLLQSVDSCARVAGDNGCGDDADDDLGGVVVVEILPASDGREMAVGLPGGAGRAFVQIHGGAAVADDAGDGDSVRFARGKRWKTYFWAWAAAMPVTLLLINASYGFVDSFRPLGSFAFDSGMMISIQHHLPAGFRVPIPGVMLEGFDAQKYDTSLGYPAFLWGTVYRGVRWYYYPAALLCKTPVALMALMLAALVTLPIARRHLAPEDFASSWSMALGESIFWPGFSSSATSTSARDTFCRRCLSH